MLQHHEGGSSIKGKPNMCQYGCPRLSVFSEPAKYRVVKIVRSSSEMILRTMKHTVIYPSSDLSLEVIALCPVI
jgi:hypothetical protein